MGKNKYTEKDAAKETESTIKEVKEAWHSAKDDSPDTVERSVHKLENMEKKEEQVKEATPSKEERDSPKGRSGR